MFRRLLRRLKCYFSLQQQHEKCQPGLFLRIAKAQRWQYNTETGELPTVETVVVDLKLRSEEKGLSLYGLCKEDEVNELACIFSLTLRDNPIHFECILFPASVLSGYQVDSVPVSEHPPFLSKRHYEIPEPSEEKLLELARRILGSPDKKVLQIKKQQIVDFAVQRGLLEAEELHGRVGNRWQRLIAAGKRKQATLKK